MKFIVLPGDGIGPEIVASAVEVLRAADRRYGLDIQLDYEDVGFASLDKHGTTLREVLQRHAATTASSLVRSRMPTTRRRTKAAATSRPPFASISTSTPTCGQHARARTCRRT